MCAFRILANSVSKVTDNTFKRKFVALGRIVTNWPEIVGMKMAGIAQPKKIHYRRAYRKGDKPHVTLEVTSSSANASLLMMKKGVIIEKINHVFGEGLITDLKFTHTAANSAPLPAQKKTKPLTATEKSRLSKQLENIDDMDLRNRLLQFGEAFLSNHNH